MSKRIESYLSKRANLERHTVAGRIPVSEIDRIIVIPALAERETLPRTLDSLTNCNEDFLERTLILVVVNNRNPKQISPEALEENRETLTWLVSDPYPILNTVYIDATSPGRELGPKDGVGTARKIGMDHALNILNQQQSVAPLIICLDADTTVDPNYLDALDAFANSKSAWAGVINYAHPVEGTLEEQAAIVSYELFLRYMELGLRYAQSPYAFHTIGSTIVCTPEAYAAVSGMNRKAAGEDFYFLQQLAKTGRVSHITDTTIYPSPRVSWRVPFGTGKRVGRFLDAEHEEWQVYHVQSYQILREWIAAIVLETDRSGEEVLNASPSIHPQLQVFLIEIDFATTWNKIRKNVSNPEKLLNQFHAFFDGFQTLKLIHHLRDNGYPEQNTFEAMGALRNLGGCVVNIPRDVDVNLKSQIAVLKQLRESN